MNDSFFIVDDDKSILNVLKNIIKEYGLGSVLGTSQDGESAVDGIVAKMPDIVLLDYFLPDKDGLEVIEEVQKTYRPLIIMISEVSDKSMIAKAYKLDIEFFITKPINVIEVVSIIRKSKESLAMKNTIRHFEKAFAHLNTLSSLSSAPSPIQPQKTEDPVSRLFGKLGIIGESGSEDLRAAILWVQNKKDKKYTLSELYSEISSPASDASSRYAIEQRIRRTISKAFNTMASIGLEDFFNPVFEDLGSHLFDFPELRKQMNYLKGTSKEQGKINIKKFLEGSCVLLK